MLDDLVTVTLCQVFVDKVEEEKLPRIAVLLLTTCIPLLYLKNRLCELLTSAAKAFCSAKESELNHMENVKLEFALN